MPSKLIPLTPQEIWKGHKPSLQHIHILGCQEHVSKPKGNKLKATFEVCLFTGYPKGMRRHYFYSEVNKKILVSTNVRCLEDD